MASSFEPQRGDLDSDSPNTVLNGGWKTLPCTRNDESPFPIEGAASCIVHFPHHQKSQYKIYVYGGVGRFSQHNQPRDLFELNLVSTRPFWRRVTANCVDEENEEEHVPPQRAHHTMSFVPHTNKLYVYGGETGSGYMKQNDPHVYELDLNDFRFTWRRLQTASESLHAKTKIPVKPLPRCYHSACGPNNSSGMVGSPCFYIFGGYNSVLDKDMGDLWQFNVKRQSWRLLSSYTDPSVNRDKKTTSSASAETAVKKNLSHPLPRYGHAMCMSPTNDKIYIIGGCTKENIPLKDIWCFDLRTNLWSQLSYDCSDYILETELSDEVKQQLHTKVTLESVSGSLGALQASNNTESGVDYFVKRKTADNFTIPFYIPARGASCLMYGTCILVTGGETLMADKRTGVPDVLKDVLIFDTSSQRLTKYIVSSDKAGSASGGAGIIYHDMLLHQDEILLVGGRLTWPYYNNVQRLSIFGEENLAKYVFTSKNRVFGISLSQLMYRQHALFTREEQDSEKQPTPQEILIENLVERDPRHRHIPMIFLCLYDYLMVKGADTEGIFRISPAKPEMQGLQLKFEQGIPACFIDLSNYNNPHAVAGLLKFFLRSLPEPLVTNELYDVIVNLFIKPEAQTRSEEDTVTELNSVIERLPEVNQLVLKLLLNLFSLIAQNSHMSFMNAENMARASAFSLLFSDDAKKDMDYMVHPQQPVIKVLKNLIDLHDRLKFPAVAKAGLTL